MNASTTPPGAPPAVYLLRVRRLAVHSREDRSMPAFQDWAVRRGGYEWYEPSLRPPSEKEFTHDSVMETNPSFPRVFFTMVRLCPPLVRIVALNARVW